MANLALSNSHFLLFAAERNNAHTVSHIERMSTNLNQVADVPASIPRSRDTDVINVRKSKLSIRALYTKLVDTVKMQTYVYCILNAFWLVEFANVYSSTKEIILLHEQHMHYL